MRKDSSPKPWEVAGRFTELSSPWLRLIGEHLIDDTGKRLEYWRVEKPHGLLVITLHRNQLILPRPMYRPGIGEYTLDFCGGRIEDPNNLEAEGIAIVQRELGVVDPKPFTAFTSLTATGWNLDTSFSNVRIYACIAKLDPAIRLDPKNIGRRYATTPEGIRELQDELVCMQCRAALHEWLLLKAGDKRI